MNKIVFLACLTLLYSCWPWKNATKPLNISREIYTGNQLRLNGIYCSDKYKVVIIFYGNGIMRGGSAYPNYTVEQVIDLLSSESYRQNKSVNDVAYDWGLFLVKDNHLNIRKWRSTDAIFEYSTSSFTGITINDSTLSIDMPVKEWKLDTFRFYPMSPKPDSVNRHFKKWFRE